MNSSLIESILKKAATIAVIGASDRPGRPVDKVGRYLIDVGYSVIPVHPVRKKVWDIDCFRDLASIDRSVDIVDVFRAPEFCAGHAQEASRLSPRPMLFWPQKGIESLEAERIVSNTGIGFVQNALSLIHL